MKNDPNTGMVGQALAGIDQPSSTICLSEGWATLPTGQSDSILKSLFGSLLDDCNTWKLPGRNKVNVTFTDMFAPCQSDYNDPAKLPAKGHIEQGNYGFTDGHVKSLRWGQVRDHDFQLYKLQKF